MKRSVRQRGISLIEAMVCLALISIAVVGSVSSYPMLMRMSQSTKLHTQALVYAQTQCDKCLRENSQGTAGPYGTAANPIVEQVGDTTFNPYSNQYNGNINDSGVNTGVGPNDASFTRYTWDVGDALDFPPNEPAPGGALGLRDLIVRVSWVEQSNGVAITHQVTVVTSFVGS